MPQYREPDDMGGFRDPAQRRCFSCCAWRWEGGVPAQEWDEAACSEGVPGVNVEITGDASTDVTTDAEFGCPGWKR